MTLLKQFIRFEWMHDGIMSIPGFKSSHWLNSYSHKCQYRKHKCRMST